MKRRDLFKRLRRARRTAEKFKNPYRRKRRDRTKLWKRGIAIAVVCVAVALPALLLRSERLMVRGADIEGAETIDREELQGIIQAYLDERAWLISRRANVLLFDEAELKRRLEERFSFERLEVSSEGERLQVSLKEKASELLWSTGNKLYVAGLDGSIIREIDQEEAEAIGAGPPAEEGAHDPYAHLRELARFKDVNAREATPGTQVLKPEEIQASFRLHAHLARLGAGQAETRVDRVTGQWMAVVTQAGYLVLFDPTDDVDRQAANLETVLRERVDDPSSLEYVDLRFGDHVYFK